MVSFAFLFNTYQQQIDMKNIHLILAMLICTMTFAQEEPLPNEINDSFYAKYPKAKYISWYNDGDNYKIDFEILSDNFTALFSNDGSWMETGKIISDLEIPDAVLSSIEKEFPDNEISYGEFIENNTGGKFYRISIYSDEDYYTINLTSDGKIMHVEE